MIKTLSLFKSPRFLPIFAAQFGGAFNDNLFKSAMLIIVAFQLTDAVSQASAINNLAALLFILPFFLLSQIAGQLADRANKSQMIQRNKIAEIIISFLAAGALFWQSIPALMIVLVLLGAQSAMFGPNKYAVLPQLMSGRELVNANALIASGTFIAILLGTLIGAVLAQQSQAWIWVGTCCVLTACMGYIAACKIPETDIGDPTLTLNWNLYDQTRILLGLARHNKRTWGAIIGVSWFWFTGVAYLTQIPAIVRYLGGGDESVVTFFLGLFIAGIGLGCALAAWISDEQAEIGISPIAIGLAGLAGLNLAWIPSPILPSDTLLSLWQFLDSHQALPVSLSILFIGLFGGAFALPLYTELQQSTRLTNRARIISINNVLNAFFMLISSALALATLGILHIDLSTYLVMIAVLNIFFAFYLHSKVSVRTWRLLAEAATRIRYKLDIKGMEKLPSEGAAILVCNHVSYSDPIVIFGASKRPIRFLMDKQIRQTFGISSILKQARTLGICSPLEDRQAYEYAMNEAVNSLKNGELVFIFPEGRLSRDGNIGHFHRGVEKLLEGHAVPVIPMAISGLWGSFFSHQNGFAFKSGISLNVFRRREVKLLVGDALQPKGLTAGSLKTAVAELYDRIH